MGHVTLARTVILQYSNIAYLRLHWNFTNHYCLWHQETRFARLRRLHDMLTVLTEDQLVMDRQTDRQTDTGP